MDVKRVGLAVLKHGAGAIVGLAVGVILDNLACQVLHHERTTLGCVRCGGAVDPLRPEQPVAPPDGLCGNCHHNSIGAPPYSHLPMPGPEDVHVAVCSTCLLNLATLSAGTGNPEGWTCVSCHKPYPWEVPWHEGVGVRKSDHRPLGVCIDCSH